MILQLRENIGKWKLFFVVVPSSDRLRKHIVRYVGECQVFHSVIKSEKPVVGETMVSHLSQLFRSS